MPQPTYADSYADNPQGKAWDDSLGTFAAVKVASGAAYALPTTVGNAQARNRQIATLSTRESVTWDSGVNEVTITVFQEAAGTAELRASAAVCFDAPTDAAADAWLTHADAKTADSNMAVVLAGVPRTFYFSGDGITRLDIKRLYGSEALGVIVEAA